MLAPLALEKQRQGERLQFRVGEVKEFSELDRDVVIGAVLVVAAGAAALDKERATLGAVPVGPEHRVVDLHAVAHGRGSLKEESCFSVEKESKRLSSI